MLTRPLIRNWGYLALISLTIAALFNACSKPTPVEPDRAPLALCELKDIRYFFKPGDRVDTTTRQLSGSRLQNLGSTLVTQQVDEGFGDLAKTSLFLVDQTVQLPEGVDLSQFAVRVPRHWFGSGLVDLSTETYPLSAVQQEKPYGFDPKAMLTISILPGSKIDVSRQIDAYQINCSFEGVLENMTTGQRYRLKGTWQGLSQYNNPTVSLKQSPL